jgi:bifunctional DNase/RNase
MTPSRPLTHDLFKNFSDHFKINLIEVIIYNLVEGIFFAKLICEQNGKEVEIDSRTSDAIALAVRFESPIYTYEFVLNSAGIILDDDKDDKDEIAPEISLEEITKKPSERMTLKELKKHLKNSIDNEDYEAASRFRDEINNRQEN